MDLQTVVTAISASAVISAIITGLVARRTNERAIQIENITKERGVWREKIREQAIDVQRAACAKDQAKLAEARFKLCLSLNPLDKEDCAIVTTVDQISKHQLVEDRYLLELADRLSLLLKHDWERAKREAKPFLFRRKPVIRIPYEELLTIRQ